MSSRPAGASPWRFSLCSTLLIVDLFEHAICTPIPGIYESQPSTHTSVFPDYAVIIASLAVVLLVLLAGKFYFIQAQQSAKNVNFKQLYLESSSSSALCNTSRESFGTGITISPRSPLWLGILGSPAKEIGLNSRKILHHSESFDKGRNCGLLLPALTLSLQHIGTWFHKVPSKPTTISDSSRHSRKRARAIYKHGLTSSPSLSRPPKAYFYHSTLSYSCGPGPSPDLQFLGSPSSTRCDRKTTSKVYLDPCAGSAESLHIDSIYSCPDRRRSTFVDTCDVTPGLGFSASKGGFKDSRQGFLQDLGPIPGSSFLEHLESGSPMPLQFRLPSPLLSFRKRPVLGDKPSTSTLNSTVPLQTSEGPADTTKPTPAFESVKVSAVTAENCGAEIEKPPTRDEQARARSYAHLGLGRPSQTLVTNAATSFNLRPDLCVPSPGSIDQDAHRKLSPLDAILDQLVQATSEWDESVFIDDRFKSLIDSSRRSDNESLLESGAEASHPGISLFSVYDLPEEPNEDPASSSSGDPFLESPCHVLRDRTRDLLFPIPEEEAISASDVVIQRY